MPPAPPLADPDEDPDALDELDELDEDSVFVVPDEVLGVSLHAGMTQASDTQEDATKKRR